MSHKTKTTLDKVDDLETAKAAMEALLAPVVDGVTEVCHYYGGKRATKVEVAYGRPGAEYHLGIERQQDGTLAFVGDFWGISLDDEQKAMLERLGPGYSTWQWKRQDGREGHVGIGTPSLFLQEYALQAVERECRKRRLTTARETAESGAVLLRIRGDYIGRVGIGGRVPEIRVLVETGGMATVSAHDIPGAKCVQATKVIEEALGRVTTRVQTADYFHTTDPRTGQEVHVGRGKR